MFIQLWKESQCHKLTSLPSSTSAKTAHRLKRLEGCRLASEDIILEGWLEESAIPLWKNFSDTAIFIWGIWSLLQPPLQQRSTIFALPWARQRTTSRHSACALAGWPPLGPCTLLSRRMSTLSCHGRWLLYSDQNLHKLKQKRLFRSLKIIIHAFAHLNCLNKTLQPAGEAPFCPCAERGHRHVCAGALPTGSAWLALVIHSESRHIIFSVQNEVLAQGRREFK